MADRAELLATAIIRIVRDALRDRIASGSTSYLCDAHTAVTAYLRDEIADIERQVRDDIRLRDD